MRYGADKHDQTYLYEFRDSKWQEMWRVTSKDIINGTYTTTVPHAGWYNVDLKIANTITSSGYVQNNG